MNITEEGGHKLTDAKRQGYAAVLAIGSTRCKANILGMVTQGLSNRWHICFYYVSVLIWTINFSGHSIMQNLPSIVQALCENWNGIHTNEFPNIGSWVHKAHGLVCQNLLIYINDLYLLLMVFMSCFFTTVTTFRMRSLFLFLAKCICKWHYSIRELHQCHPSSSSGHTELSGFTSGPFSQTHPTFTDSPHWWHHRVSPWFV